MKKNTILLGIIAAVLCETLFGFSYLFTKSVSQVASAWEILSWRFLLAFFCLVLLRLLGIIKINFNHKNLKPLLLLSLFQPIIYFTAETLGISQTTASESGAFLACIPVVTLLFSSSILRKKPSRYQLVGILTTLIGVLICTLASGLKTSFSWSGYFFLALAVVAYSLYSIFVEKAEEFDSLEKTYIMVASGAIIFTGLALIENFSNHHMVHFITLPLEHQQFLVAILFQGICCSVIAFFLSNFAIKHIGVNRTSSFVGLSTVVSILSGIIILHENFTVLQVLGSVVIVGGVYLANSHAKNS